jgi:hypothetical protein
MTPGQKKPVFNRTITLKDTWAKEQGKGMTLPTQHEPSSADLLSPSSPC